MPLPGESAIAARSVHKILKLQVVYVASLLVAACTAAAQTITSTVTLTSTGFAIKVQSANEAVTYQWIAPAAGSMYTIGSMTVTDSISGASPQGQIEFGSHLDWRGPSEALQS